VGWVNPTPLFFQKGDDIMSDVEVITMFFGEILGVVFSFILYIFTEVELFGINLLEVIFVGLVAFAIVWIARIIL